MSVLPGMSSPGQMQRALPKDLHERLSSQEDDGPLVLAICMGLHMLFESSAEQGEPKSTGIALLDGHVKRLDTLDGWTSGRDARLPHVGWRSLTPTAGTTDSEWPVLVEPTSTFYFAHSFGVPYVGQPFVQQIVNYAGVSLCAYVTQGRVHGVQFHPEMSGPPGIAFLKSLLRKASE